MNGFAGKARKALRRTWMKYAMKGVAAADRHDKLDLAYAIEDPWNLGGQRETLRFAATNALIQRHCGTVGSLLEIGSGEGHQTACFSQLAADVTGVEVSERAVARARLRLPTARFVHGDVSSDAVLHPSGRYDVVTACEVLYYMSDPAATLRRMEVLGRYCCVTVFAPAAPKFHALLGERAHAERSWFAFGGETWVACLWRSP
jgi:protein-L-isoaspartate O-methyltransferase